MFEKSLNLPFCTRFTKEGVCTNMNADVGGSPSVLSCVQMWQNIQYFLADPLALLGAAIQTPL